METNIEKLMKNTKKQLVELYLKTLELDNVQKVVNLELVRDELISRNESLEAEYKALEKSYNNAIEDCKGTHQRNNEIIEEIDTLATSLVTLKKNYADLKILSWCLGGLVIGLGIILFFTL